MGPRPGPAGRRRRGGGGIDLTFDFKPSDFSDAGNAEIFGSFYAGELAYTDALGWLWFDGRRWDRGDHAVMQRAVELTDTMLADARAELYAALQAQASAKLEEAERIEGSDDRLQKAERAVSGARSYFAHAGKSRNTPRIMAMLELCKHSFVIPLDKLDADPFALNTPDGIVDLRTGALRRHGAETAAAWCTHITATPPGTKGAAQWLEFLETIACGDAGLERDLQQVAGMAAIGAVYHEGIVIAHGGGRNGKSTFFNVLAAVLGDYAGTIDPKVLTTERQNKGAALATLRGKRLVLAAELEEHQRLSTSTLKQLASTDRLTIEEKYRQPDTITPSHTLVLFTNFLPRVGATDDGTWRRLTVVPFNAVISQADARQNYAGELARETGPAILSWIIQGAVSFVQAGCKLHLSTATTSATEDYRARENWLENFIDERCIREPNARVGARELYNAYRAWAQENGEYVRREADFSNSMEAAGYIKITPKNRKTWIGLHLDLARIFGSDCTATG